MLKDEKHMRHTPWDTPKGPIQSALEIKDPKDLLASVHEAYKKHSAELASLEDRQNKTLVLIIGLFGAGVTALTAADFKISWPFAVGFSVIVLCLGYLGHHATNEATDLRKAVRDLLVRCEVVMQFYTPDVFVKGRPLYDDAEREYAYKGVSLPYLPYFVVWVPAAVLLILICVNCYQGPIKKNEPCCKVGWSNCANAPGSPGTRSAP